MKNRGKNKRVEFIILFSVCKEKYLLTIKNVTRLIQSFAWSVQKTVEALVASVSELTNYKTVTVSSHTTRCNVHLEVKSLVVVHIKTTFCSQSTLNSFGLCKGPYFQNIYCFNSILQTVILYLKASKTL